MRRRIRFRLGEKRENIGEVRQTGIRILVVIKLLKQKLDRVDLFVQKLLCALHLRLCFQVDVVKIGLRIGAHEDRGQRGGHDDEDQRIAEQNAIKQLLLYIFCIETFQHRRLSVKKQTWCRKTIISAAGGKYNGLKK